MITIQSWLLLKQSFLNRTKAEQRNQSSSPMAHLLKSQMDRISISLLRRSSCITRQYSSLMTFSAKTTQQQTWLTNLSESVLSASLLSKTQWYYHADIFACAKGVVKSSGCKIMHVQSVGRASPLSCISNLRRKNQQQEQTFGARRDAVREQQIYFTPL